MNDDFLKFLDELRARFTLSDIVGEKVKLQKRGHEYTGLCPFHNEKTPSFTVNNSKGFYHCFGCGAHGDVITFLTQSEGLPFYEAVKKLAARAGVDLPKNMRENEENYRRNQSLYEIMELAADFYQKKLYLPVGENGLKYFKEKRGLSDETIRKFRLGYAPGSGSLKAYLQSKGVSQKDMVDLGLLVIPEDVSRRTYDFFYERVIIPIMDKQNRVIAFGGRILGDGHPKYLNSPETPIFNKRHILYNMNIARAGAYAQKRLIICEGYMDVIALDSYNFNYAVAPLGTALTQEQILAAWNVCATPTLCFDGDGAGIKAAIRSIDRILPILRIGCSVNYIFLKEKKDPDELLRTLGPQVFEKYLQRAKPLVDILWHKCKMNKSIETPEGKAILEKETMSEVAKIKDVKIRNFYTQEMKKRLNDIFGKNITDAINTNYKNTFQRKNSPIQQYNFIKKPPLNDFYLRRIVAAMINYPQLISQYEEKIMSFELEKSVIAKILLDIIEMRQEDEHLDKERILEKLKLNYAAEISQLWEIDMYSMHKMQLIDIKREINNSLSEIQLKQLDIDIKECIALINQQPENSENLYLRYQQLIKERNSILTEDV